MFPSDKGHKNSRLSKRNLTHILPFQHGQEDDLCDGDQHTHSTGRAGSTHQNKCSCTCECCCHCPDERKKYQN